jgi:hypothetical protein
MKYLKALQHLTLISVFFLLLSLFAHALTSTIYSNIAWVSLNNTLQSNPANSKNLERVANQFQEALSLDQENRSAWFGRGLAYAMYGDIDLAHSSWSKGGIVPDVLTQYGIEASRDEHLDSALIFFRGAADFRNEVDSEEIYLAGSVCQQSFASPTQLSQKNSQFCAEILAKNRNNLILNGDADTKNLHGWQGKYYFTEQNRAYSSIEDSAESNGLVFKLVGNAEGNHFGLFQRVSLPAGSTVRFSGRFKVEAQEDLEARMLYIGWRGIDGKSEGNQGALQDSDLEWTKFEREFTVPEDAASSIDFYPAVFNGQGTIWFDDVRLELITD